jgi:hypothetical protein
MRDAYQFKQLPQMHTQAGTALYTALNEACSNVKRLGKDGHNEGQHYDYTSAEAIIEYSGKLLADAGVVAVRTTYEIGEMIKDRAPDKVWNEKVTPGQETYMRIVTSTFRVTHAETGETEFCVHPFPAVLSAGKPWDKAIAGALTTSLSYFLRDLLRIPRADGDTMDQRDDRTEEDHQQRRDNHAAKQQKQPVKKKVKKKAAKKQLPLHVRIHNAIVEAPDTATMDKISDGFNDPTVGKGLTKTQRDAIDAKWATQYDVLLAKEKDKANDK